MEYFSGHFNVIVVGAGHAGIEAALAPARMNKTVLCLCTSLDAVGNMPCNPSIGGTAKGQLVREIDALGGGGGVDGVELGQLVGAGYPFFLQQNTPEDVGFDHLADLQIDGFVLRQPLLHVITP